jgi:UDP-glucuronate decarboxylase
LSKDTLLIIGGTGFFGRTFCQAHLHGKLDRFGIKRLILVARHASEFAMKSGVVPTDTLQFQDIDTSKPFKLPDCSYLMHFAASSSKVAFAQNLKLECDNISSSMSQTVAAVKAAVKRPSHLLMASSGAVYGPTSTKLFSETDSTGQFRGFGQEKAFYGAAKLNAEKCFKRLSGQDLSLTIARCFTFVGPELPLDSHFVAGNLIQNIITRSALQIKAQSPVSRSYLHTDDLVIWLCNLMLNGNPDCPVVNVGSADVVSIQELARKLANHYRLPADITEFEHEEVDLYAPDVALASRLGLTPTKNSLDAIIHTADFLFASNFSEGV